MSLRISQFAGARASYRPVGQSFLTQSRGLPAPRVGPSFYSGPRASQNNPVAVRAFSNFNNMANNRAFTRGFHHPNAGGYSEAYGNMRGMVNQGIANNMGRKPSNQQPMQPQQVITIMKPRPFTGATTTGGQAVNKSWSAQPQNSAGLGRNRGYSSGMKQFAINSSANAGLNRMR